jgi:hypothetical protein
MPAMAGFETMICRWIIKERRGPFGGRARCDEASMLTVLGGFLIDERGAAFEDSVHLC